MSHARRGHVRHGGRSVRPRAGAAAAGAFGAAGHADLPASCARWGWTSPPTFTPCPTLSRPSAAVAAQTWRKGARHMLRDITIGQHFPGNSVLHRCDPRLKLVATIAYIVVLFVALNPAGPGAVYCPAGGAVQGGQNPRQADFKEPKAYCAHRAVHGGAQPVFCHRRGRAACPHLGVENLRGGHHAMPSC